MFHCLHLKQRDLQSPVSDPKPEAKAFVEGALFIFLWYRNAFVTNKKVNRT